MHLHHEGSMIGVQCHWWFVEDTSEHLQVHFNFFAVNASMEKLMFKSNFALLSSFQVKFERAVNSLRGQKSYQLSIQTWSMGIQCENRNIFICGLIGIKRHVLFGLKSKKRYLWWDTPTYTLNLFYISAGMLILFKDLKSVETPHLRVDVSFGGWISGVM